jgi:hypothetical protein
LNEKWDDQSERIEAEAESCERAIDATIDIFKDNAFRRWNQSEYERPFNRAVYDVMVFYLADGDARAAALANGDGVEEAFRNACADPAFSEALRSTTKSIDAISYRLKTWGRALEEVLSMPLAVPTLQSGRITYSE